MLGAAGVLVTDGATFAGLGDFPKWTDANTVTYDIADTMTLAITMTILFSFAEHKRLFDLKNPGSQGAVGSFLGAEAALGGSGVTGYPGKAFDPLAVHLMGLGERTGTLAEQFVRLSKHYAVQTKASIDVATKLAEPAILLLVGGLFMFLVGALLLPVYDIITSVSGQVSL
jgi:hypothetical protein